jgi:hypothetical protein
MIAVERGIHKGHTKLSSYDERSLDEGVLSFGKNGIVWVNPFTASLTKACCCLKIANRT